MKTFRGFLVDLGLVTAAIAAAAILLIIGLYLAKYPPLQVLSEWVKGAVGSKDDWLRVLKRSTPLIFTGLAAGVAFRSGVFNIGAEGQAMLGALGAVTLATRLMPGLGPSWIAVPAALVVAGMAGALWALIAAALERYRGVSVVLSTILLNFVAVHLLAMLLEGPLKAHTGSGIVQSDQFSAAFQLPNIVERSTANLHAGFLIAVGIVAVSWLLQARTTFGFEILVTGLNPTAARLAGMPMTALQFSIMLISGALAGISGGMQVMAVEGRSLSTGGDFYGYAGIAVALLGRLHPAGILLAALFFAALDVGAANLDYVTFPMRGGGTGQLPQAVADMVKGVVVLMVLVGTAQMARRQYRAGGGRG